MFESRTLRHKGTQQCFKFRCVHGVTSYALRRCLTEEPRCGLVERAADDQAGYAAKSEDHYQHAHMIISYLYGVIIYEDAAVRKDVYTVCRVEYTVCR